MARKPKNSKQEIAVKPIIEITDNTFTYYCNYAEVSQNQYEFAISFARLPQKPTKAQFETAKSSGEFVIEGTAQILLPLNLVKGLMRALETQKTAYEKRWNVDLPEAEQ